MTHADCTTHTTVTLDAVVGPKAESIRSIIRGDIFAGVPREETRAKIATLHAGSAADTKFTKHYGWYKSKMTVAERALILANAEAKKAAE